MKTIIKITLALTLVVIAFPFQKAQAQTPEKLNYQAVIRDNSGLLIANQSLDIRISILQGAPDGNALYIETQTASTNDNGLISIQIGDGNIISGNFGNINWSDGPYFLMTETKFTGETNYSITGTTQLLSVPYALHSKTAENLVNEFAETDPVFNSSVAGQISYLDIEFWNNKQNALSPGAGITIDGNTISVNSAINNFYLGQDTLGGIVFYLYYDENGSQHGMIVSKEEGLTRWQEVGVATGATRSWDGAYNTNLMTDSPAAIWLNETFSSEWYLPSVDELSLLWQNRYHVNKTLNNLEETLLSNDENYWSSTEVSSSQAFYFNFKFGSASNGSKAITYSLRAMREF